MNGNWDEIWNSLSEGMGGNPARKLRQNEILRKLKNGKSLDFGAGDGELVIRMRELGLHAIGVEMSQEGIAKANSKSQSLGFGDVLFGLDSKHLFEDTYDNIIVSEVIEHIENPVPILKTLHKNLKNDGLLIISVPAGPISRFDRFIGHYRHYSKGTLRAEIEEAEFQVLKINQIGFPLINLVRIWCLIRGEKMIQELEKPNRLVNSAFGKFLIRILSSTFKFDTNLGWQLIAVAKSKSLTDDYPNHSKT